MDKQMCEICGKEIKTMVFKNTGVCSGRCEMKRRKKETTDG